MNPVLQHREWLIQPEALQSMAASLRGLVDRGGFLPKQGAESPLLSVENGIGVVAIEGPILRKPDLFARIFFGATSSEDIGEAIHEAAGRDDIRAMNTTIEDELAQARSELEALQQDHQAQTDLLNEESGTANSLRGEVETLSGQLDTLTGEHDKAIEQVATLRSRITELEASQSDFDRKLQLEVARVVASTGTTMPARRSRRLLPPAPRLSFQRLSRSDRPLNRKIRPLDHLFQPPKPPCPTAPPPSIHR